jgi:hypothetical protein
VNIFFYDEPLSNACYNEHAGIRRWGKARASVVRRRIIAILTAPSLEHLMRMGPLLLKPGPEPDQFSIDASDPYRIVLLPNHDPMPRDGDGKIVYAGVTDVCLLDIRELHGR